MSQNIPLYIPTYIGSLTYQPARVLPRIFFYNGLVSCQPYFLQGFQYGATNSIFPTEFTNFPYFDHYNVVTGSFPTTNSKSLLFNNEQPAYGFEPTENLYTEYWKRYIDLLYNPYTRLLNCSAIIPLADYFNMELNDIVQFRGNVYHLRAINNYSLKNGTCDLQLLGPILNDVISSINPELSCDFDFSFVENLTPTTTLVPTTLTPTTLTPTTLTPTTTLVPTTTITPGSDQCWTFSNTGSTYGGVNYIRNDNVSSSVFLPEGSYAQACVKGGTTPVVSDGPILITQCNVACDDASDCTSSYCNPVYTFTNSGRGDTDAEACTDAVVNNRTFYSNCNPAVYFGNGCRIFTDAAGTTKLTGYDTVFMNGSVWDYSPVLGYITAVYPRTCPTTTTTLTPTTTLAPTTTAAPLTSFGGCGYGSSTAAACNDAGVNNRTLYSNCDGGTFGVGCYVYVDTFPNPLTGYTNVFINLASWDINSSTGVITAYSSVQC
jgi:hypothetical protein